ncbi:MAG TPA: diaminopimelate epimerase [Chitinophagales bacterium]|nr:diaminopimelate epimerase [Chitinophagales bacterium]HRK28366.1 diaminopimelate epimerase [Chitinophagales bacterium]
MFVSFAKYHGTGNDFIMIDNRSAQLPRYAPDLYAQWCHRRFGVGADGVILLQPATGYDFEMVYYNADGHEGSMCGNGGRCAVAFAHKIGFFTTDRTSFLATDGAHEAVIASNGWIWLLMQPVNKVEQVMGNYVLNTGSPHFVCFTAGIEQINVPVEGAKIRYSPPYKEKGINVNFVEPTTNALQVATYERGVEDETFSCGTGVVASGIAYALQQNKIGNVSCPIVTKGGTLEVSFTNHQNLFFTDIWLKGPATHVFDGLILR